MNRLFLLKKISTSSSYFIRTTWTATPQTISKITYKQSSIPYTYIHEEMDAAMDLESFKDSKKEIFEMTQPRYNSES